MNWLKQPIHRSPSWLAAVRAIESCVLCGNHGTQAAHRNEGKGMGLKVDDCLTAAICQDCHFIIDNGKDLTLMERRELMDKAILKTLVELARGGKVKAAA